MEVLKYLFSFHSIQLGAIPWATVLEGKGVCESWLAFKWHFFQALDPFTPMSKKSGKDGRRPVWMSKELIHKLKGKKIH